MIAPRATSVSKSGEPDGWEIPAGWRAELGPEGETRLVVSVPNADLGLIHQDLIKAMAAPLGLLYRQEIDRASPRPEGSPPRDFVGLEVPVERLLQSLSACDKLIYHDARANVWVRGALGEQLILDADGLLYCYPDDPAFRDVLSAHGLPEELEETITARDYVKHWFYADNDDLEARLIQELNLTEMAARG